MALKEYQVVGRLKPLSTKRASSNPPLYRMRIFAQNHVVAKSRFWFFLKKMKRVKRANGEVVSLNELHDPNPRTANTYGIWIRYDSRSGTHNMYKEYRALTRAQAVESCYNDMAARHRARFDSIHIINVQIVKSSDVRRPHIAMLLKENLKFPLVHNVANEKAKEKKYKSTFIAYRPNTFQ